MTDAWFVFLLVASFVFLQYNFCISKTFEVAFKIKKKEPHSLQILRRVREKFKRKPFHPNRFEPVFFVYFSLRSIRWKTKAAWEAMEKLNLIWLRDHFTGGGKLWYHAEESVKRAGANALDKFDSRWRLYQFVCQTFIRYFLPISRERFLSKLKRRIWDKVKSTKTNQVRPKGKLVRILNFFSPFFLLWIKKLITSF